MNSTQLLETLARATWRLLDRSRSNRVLIGEDAITSINLNLLASSVADIAFEDTRIDEARRGCDFDLWIGSDARGWARYAVQAKKLTISKDTYSRLSHSVRGRRQIDILEEYARLNRAAATYCFYNYSRQPHEWVCGLRRESEQLGCSITTLGSVRQSLATRGGRSFTWMHSRHDTLPWRCLVTCPRLLGHSSTCGTHTWPERDSHLHPKLPESLKRLGEPEDLSSLYQSSDLFSQETSLRPARLVVINLDEDAEAHAANNARFWAMVSALLSPLLFGGKSDRAWAVEVLEPLKQGWGMDNEVFDVYVEVCFQAGALLSEVEFISKLASFDGSDPRIRSVILYLLGNLSR